MFATGPNPKGTAVPASDERSPRLLRELTCAAGAIALVAAAIQVSQQVFTALVMGQLVFTSRHVPWMAPLGYLAWVALVAVPAAGLLVVVPRSWIQRVAIAAMAAATVFGLLVTISTIAVWAKGAVALGVGARLGSVSWDLETRRRIGTVSAAAALVLVVAGTATLGQTGGSTPRQAAGTTQGAPNVLLIVLDVVRAASTTVGGYSRQTTPSLERIGREGATFTQAWSTAPWTLPSHASLFTGRYPTSLRADYRHGMESGVNDLASVLRARGYQTVGITGNAYYTSWDARIGQHFDDWRDYRISPRQVLLSAWPWQMNVVRAIEHASGTRAKLSAIRHGSFRAPATLSFDARHATQVRRDFLRWQATIPEGTPFFAFLNMFDAHRPRYAPSPYLARFTATPRGRDYYDGAIAYMDDEIGTILDSLAARGALANTLVIVTGDHGELFGEHDLFGHSTSTWRDVLWVPLVMRYPGKIPAGTRVTTPVSLRDVAATTLALVGGRDSTTQLPGGSLVGLFRGDPATARSPVFAFAHRGVNVDPDFPNGRGPVFSLRLDSLHYIRDGRNMEHLFNLVSDSEETINLARSPGLQSILQSARAITDSLRGSGGP